MYIMDMYNYRVLKVLPGEPLGSVVAGGQGSGSSLTQLGACYGVAIDSQSNVYVSDYSYHRVTKWVTSAAGTIVSISAKKST